MSLSASVWGERPRDFVAGGVLGFLARLGLGCRFGLDFAITYHPPGRSPGNGLPYSLSNDTRVSTYQITVAYWSNQPHLAQRQRISEPEAAPTGGSGAGEPRCWGDLGVSGIFRVAVFAQWHPPNYIHTDRWYVKEL